MLRLQNIKLKITEDESLLKEEILKALRIPENLLIDYKISKKSIDARKKNDIYFIYSIDLRLVDEDKNFKKIKNKNLIKIQDKTYEYVEKGNKNIDKRPVIIGTGPCGIFAGLILAQMNYKPILIERGKSVEERIKDIREFWDTGKLNTESNVQFGEGGAGTFSDGKLNTLTKDPRGRKVLEEFVLHGAPKEILYKNKPHIGSDNLRRVMINMRKSIIELGGEVRFESKLTDLIIEDERVKAIMVNGNEEIRTDLVLLALGHSARDSFDMIYKRGLEIQQKAFSIGVRIEHPQSLIDRVQYGNFAQNPKLGSAEYKLSAHFDNDRSAYSFCMCPGGVVVAAGSEENGIVTNGMSYYKRDKENANSAILVGVSPKDFGSDHPLAGVDFQRKWERKAFELAGGDYRAPAQLVGDFLAGRESLEIRSVKPTYKPGIKLGDLSKCLPEYVTSTLRLALVDFDRKIKGFADEDAIMTGVETRSSSPIRIMRNKEYESNIRGIYPMGEGAGYAGGIMSAAVDGIRVAEQIARE